MTQKQPDPLAAYLLGLGNEARSTLESLDRLIRRWQPGLEVELWQSMGYPIIGYGRTSYVLRSGRTNDWFIVGLADHKSYFSLYVWGFADGQYLLERYRDRLGRVKIGRACLNFKSLDDLDLKTLKQVIGRAVDSAA